MLKKILIGISLLPLITSCSSVGPTEIGVKTRLNKIEPNTLGSGVYFTIPGLDYVNNFNTQLQTTEIKADSLTKDLQQISALIVINWKIDPEKVAQIYKELGTPENFIKNVITPNVNEVVKSSTAKRNIEDLITNRISFKEEIDTVITQRLAEYNIVVSDVSITNFEFGAEFNSAIESKQMAEQEAKKAEYEALRSKNLAQARINEAQGISESNKLIQQTLTPPNLRKTGHCYQNLNKGFY